MTDIENLLAIMARLRDPDTGCPWDLKQSFASIVPHTIEEAYEVGQAIEDDDMAALADELGDLLFQIVFYARMAEESGDFDFNAVVRQISEKMVRRHPHVFADANIASADTQTRSWEALKAEERQQKAAARGKTDEGALAGVARALPALARAVKLQRRAARVGFDWPDLRPVLAKLREELDELEAELDSDGAAPERLADEVGDVLFVCANIARHAGIDAEVALRACNAKFERRFARIEALLAEAGRTPDQASLEEMDALWDRAKAEGL